MTMKPYQKSFIELALDNTVLKFGEFTLKSGRISPYFFNAGLFASGSAMNTLAECYAQTILDANIEYDVLFGPAYKGIPLVAAVAMKLAEKTGEDVPYAYNRKEAKAHGEGGMIVGAAVQGKNALILDDVMTAGTAVRQVIDILAIEQAEVAGVVIALDRQEKGQSELSAVQELKKEHSIQTHSIVGMNTLIQYLSDAGTQTKELESMQAYRANYGANDSATL